MNMKRLPFLLLALTLALPSALQAQQIPSPEEFFGFQMGADRQLARWDKLVEYYELLGERSPRLEVVNMGPSTWGNPFLEPVSPRGAAAVECHLERPPGRHGGGDRPGRGQRTGGGGAVHGASLHRGGREPDGGGADLRHGDPGRRRDAAHPGQHHRHHDPLLQSRRRDHGHRLVQPVGGHGVRGHGHAVALSPLHRPRQQP